MPTNTTMDALEASVDRSIALTASALTQSDAELTLAQWRVLTLVANEPDGVKVSALAERTESAMPATSRLVSRLRRRGLLEGHRDEHDHRVVLISVTPLGTSIRARVSARRREMIERTLETHRPGCRA